MNNVPINAKFAGKLAVGIGKIVQKLEKDKLRVSKVMVAFLKHPKFCNSQTNVIRGIKVIFRVAKLF